MVSVRRRRIPIAIIRAEIARRPRATDAFIAIALGCPACDVRDARKPLTRSPNGAKPKRIKNGKPFFVSGEAHALAKLSDDLVRRMRLMAAAGATYEDLMAVSGVSRATVSKVVKRKAWRHVADEVQVAA